jgi:hypothetical protein
MKVYKFVGDGGKPFNSDSDNPFRYPLEIGAEVSHEGAVEMCHSGLHFSRTEAKAIETGTVKFDPALGLIFLEVEVEEADIQEECDDKFVLKSGAKAKITSVQNRHLVGNPGEPTEISDGVWMLSGSATVEAWGSATVRASGSATIIIYNGTIQHIIEDSYAFIVDRSNGAPVGYNSAQWNEKIKKEVAK